MVSIFATFNHFYVKSNISRKTHKNYSFLHQDFTFYCNHYLVQGESLKQHWLEEFFVSKSQEEKLSLHLLQHLGHHTEHK